MTTVVVLNDYVSFGVAIVILTFIICFPGGSHRRCDQVTKPLCEVFYVGANFPYVHTKFFYVRAYLFQVFSYVIFIIFPLIKEFFVMVLRIVIHTTKFQVVDGDLPIRDIILIIPG